MYDVSGFTKWVNPIYKGVMDEAREKGITTSELLGLRSDAPQSAKDAFAKYCEDVKWARDKKPYSVKL